MRSFGSEFRSHIQVKKSRTAMPTHAMINSIFVKLWASMGVRVYTCCVLGTGFISLFMGWAWCINICVEARGGL